MPKNIKTKQGFTIIEVVLVLAVAGLIFLMVFIALPSLQRTQRDTQRRQDYSILSTAVTNYIANNGGKLSKLVNVDTSNPGINEGLDERLWINVDGLDPNGYPYELIAYNYNTWNALSATDKVPGATIDPGNIDITDTEVYDGAGTNGSQVFIVTNANCSGSDSQGNSIPARDDAARAYVIYGYLEGGGTYCQDVGKTQN